MCYDITKVGDILPTRMEKYYKTNNTKSRVSKNQNLYRTIYEDVEYSNVEGISVIERNEKIDINMIKELINSQNNIAKDKIVPKEKEIKKICEDDKIERNYDICDVLNKAKSERVHTERKITDTQYNILKTNDIEIYEDEDTKKADLKNMIDAISNNSKLNYTSDLLDDLKTIHDEKMKDEIEENIENKIDTSFYTSSMGFKQEDFEEMKDDIKQNNVLTKILLFVLLIVIVTGLIFLFYHFKG